MLPLSNFRPPERRAAAGNYLPRCRRRPPPEVESLVPPETHVMKAAISSVGLPCRLCLYHQSRRWSMRLAQNVQLWLTLSARCARALSSRHERVFPRKRLVKPCTRRFRGNVLDVAASAITIGSTPCLHESTWLGVCQSVPWAFPALPSSLSTTVIPSRPSGSSSSGSVTARPRRAGIWPITRNLRAQTLSPRTEVIGYVAIISSTGPALVGIAASPGGNDKLSPRRWRCAWYGQRPSADAGPRNRAGHPLRVIFVAGRAFLAQDCGRSTRPAERARFGASVGSLHRCRRIPVSLRK